MTSEVRKRKLNLVFEGLEGTAQENPKRIIIDLLQKSGDLPNSSDINTVYWLGEANLGNPRPILVSLHSDQQKKTFSSAIKQQSEISTLWIKHDLPDLTGCQTENTIIGGVLT